jgi:hypothetical protein
MSVDVRSKVQQLATAVYVWTSHRLNPKVCEF